MAKHLIDNAKTRGKFFTKYNFPHVRKNSKYLESVFIVNQNNVTYQYININVSLNKLFYMTAMLIACATSLMN